MRMMFALSLCISSPGWSQDTLTFKNGNELRGEVVQETEAQYVLRCNGGTINIRKELVAKISHEGRVDADYLAKVEPGHLPCFDDLVRAMGKQGCLKGLRQVPATVIDIGELRDVPYQSFRAGDFEVNIYGDPEDPAGVEIGVYGASLKLNQPKEDCVQFVTENVLADAGDKQILQGFQAKKNSATHGPLTIEVSPETDADSYGGWWIDVYDKAKLEKARATAAEKRAITVQKSEVAQVSSASNDAGDEENVAWSKSDLADTRRSGAVVTPTSVGSNGGSVYVRGYYRKDGTYVHSYSRSGARRR